MKLSVLLFLSMALVGCGGNASAVATTAAPLAATLPTIAVSPAPGQTLAVSHTVTGTLQLSAPAPAGGLTVSVSSASAAIVAVTPATVSVAPGATAASFTYTGLLPGSVTLSATAPGYAAGSMSVASTALPIPRSLFGMSVNKASLETLNMPFTYGTTRTWDVYPELGWDAISAGPGYYNWAYLDAYIAATQASNQADIIYTLGHTPLWASSQPTVWCKEGPGSCAPPARMQDWDDWVRAIATHTKGKIHVWELWNEPQDLGYYAGDIPTMVTMAQHAYTIIKGIDPNAIILSPAPVGGYGPGWMNQFLAAGGGKYVDVIAFHGYWSAVAEDIAPVVASFRAVMAANGVADKPMWDTESDYSGDDNPPSNYADRAAFVAKYYLLHWALGVDRFAWYMYDGGWWGGLWDAVAGVHADGTAYATVKNWMEGASMTKPCSADGGGTWSCEIVRPGNYFGRIVWNSTATVPYTPATNFTRMRTLTGATMNLTGAALSIGTQPILLEGSPAGAAVAFAQGQATTQLVYLQQPQSAYATTAMSTVQVAVEDSQGNIATNTVGYATLQLTVNLAGATLSGTTTADFINGVATFDNLSANIPGQFTMTASSAGMIGVPSVGFTIVALPVATHLAFVQQPQSAYQGTTMAAVQVADEDASGNIISSASGYVALQLVGGAGGTLSGTTAAFLVNGVATFTDLSVNVASGYTMAANSSAGYSSAFSVPFSIAPTPPTPTAAARFMDQSSFGPTDASIAYVQFLGMQNYLQGQFLTTPTLIPTYQVNPPSFCGDVSACVRYSWWGNALNAPDQLRQRVAFSLSQLFVVSTQSVDPRGMPLYLNTLTQDAFSNWYTLMKDVTLTPAMGSYLNMANSLKPSNGTIANQNFAREMLQIFSTGTVKLNNDGSPVLDGNGQPVPLYTQAQIDGFARAYTGWTYANPNGGPSTDLNWAPNMYAPLAPIDAYHDTGAKQLLDGVTLPAGQSAAQDMEAALQNIFSNSTLPPYVCKQLIQHLVTSNPSPGYIADVVAVFLNNGYGVRGDMRAVVTAILMNPEARAGDAGTVDSTFGHQREPILWLTGAYRGLEAKPALSDIRSYVVPDVQALNMGQWVQAPPSVFNFYSTSYNLPGTATLAPEFELEQSASVQARLNSANDIAFADWAGYMNIDFGYGGRWAGLAGPDCNPLLDLLNRVFLHSQMPATMRTTLYNTISGIPNPVDRARMAVYLVLTSPQFKYSN